MPFSQLPGSGDLFNYFVDFDTRRLEPWEKIIPSFKYSSDIPYFDLLVPTLDTVRFGFLMEKLLAINRSVMFTGTTGVGKVSLGSFVWSWLLRSCQVIFQYFSLI